MIVTADQVNFAILSYDNGFGDMGMPNGPDSRLLVREYCLVADI